MQTERYRFDPDLFVQIVLNWRGTMTLHKRKSRMCNPYHDHPLMRKGGAHEKPYKAKRKDEKQKLKKEWCSLMIFSQV